MHQINLNLQIADLAMPLGLVRYGRGYSPDINDGISGFICERDKEEAIHIKICRIC